MSLEFRKQIPIQRPKQPMKLIKNTFENNLFIAVLQKPDEVPQPPKKPDTIPSPEPGPGVWPKKEPEIQPEREPLTVPPKGPQEVPPPPEKII